MASNSTNYITSFDTVRKEFFALFLSGLTFDRTKFNKKTLDFNQVWVNGRLVNLKVPVTYYKKSSFNITELSKIPYPVISIQDFPAMPVENWNTFVREKYFDNLNISNRKWETFSEPHAKRMSMQFDVSVASKSLNAFETIKLWFYQTFDVSENRKPLEFCEHYKNFEGVAITDELEYGKLATLNKVVKIFEPVNYTFGENLNIDRSDGVLETTFSFELFFWINLSAPKKLDSIQAIEVSFNTEKVSEIISEINLN
jgi:hypothetical protein